MRIAILSDIHANLEALTEALRLCDTNQADCVICLGDVVGYGPDPGPCIDLVKSSCEACVLGNHDEAVAFGSGLEFLPKDGQAVAQRHTKELSEEQLFWLKELPISYVAYNTTFVHASPDDPGNWTRLESFQAVQAQFSCFDTPVCFVGHSHKPAVVSSTLGVHRVRPGHRFLVDVGSVGQPRDSDYRLAFALFDTDRYSCEIIRGHYDVERTANRIEAAGLPSNLAQRLLRGV